MLYTRTRLWLREPPDEVRLTLPQIIGHKGFNWTGFSGHEYDERYIWCLEIYNITDERLTLVHTLFSEYIVESPPDRWSIR